MAQNQKGNADVWHMEAAGTYNMKARTLMIKCQLKMRDYIVKIVTDLDLRKRKGKRWVESLYHAKDFEGFHSKGIYIYKRKE